LILKLLGSEGVRAAAGEVGFQHIERFSLPLSIVALVLTLGLTLFIGRAVCGYGCPVGSLQELLYDIPIEYKGIKKLILPTKLSFFIRLGMLFMIIGLYLTLGLDLIQVIAPYQLWRIDLAVPGVVIMAFFFFTSPLIYRPFCRLFCPYGAIAALIAKFSMLRLEKTGSCTECNLCNVKCPTGELDHNYGECYLCGRCYYACSLDAVEFNLPWNRLMNDYLARSPLILFKKREKD
jgi:polyferredoxin